MDVLIRRADGSDGARIRDLAAASKGHRMGPREVGSVTSSWGRTLPVMRVEL